MADPFAASLRAGLDRLVRGGLRGVWLRGALPCAPFVYAANHHSWWDPFVAAAVLGRHRPAGLLMDQTNLERFTFARRLGVFGSGEPRTGLRQLADGRVLVVFPEGQLRPAGPLGPLAPGAAWYARRGGVSLVAAAVRVALRGHQAPEAYVAAVNVDTTGDLAMLTGRLAEELRRQLALIDSALAGADPREPLAGFWPVVHGRRSWDERLAGRAR
jgi:1-acyl-sn-glycerol-3-phosphate acyltransferase